MNTLKPLLKITTEQWDAKRSRGLAALIDHRAYIVMTHETTREPVYQPVAILRADQPH
jgi:hypothetical protein